MERNITRLFWRIRAVWIPSVLIPWLKEHYGWRGHRGFRQRRSGTELDVWRRGAQDRRVQAVYRGSDPEFVDDYIIPSMKAGATL